MTADQERLDFYKFKPAPEGATPEERSAVAMEFIARQMGEMALTIRFLSDEQMNSLISNLPS